MCSVESPSILFGGAACQRECIDVHVSLTSHLVG